MSELAQKIAKQSKIVLILIEVARIILYVTLGLTVAALVCTFLDRELPVLILFGKPIYALDLTKELPIADARAELMSSIIQLALVQGLLYMLTSLFRRIQTSQTPFTPAVVKSMKSIGIVLGVVVALDNGYLGVVIAFVVYAFALIFDYGGELQQQVDETL